MKTNIPYSEKLKDPRWQKKRLEIFSRDKWQCRFCGDNQTTLNVHHFTYNGEPWEADNSSLITTCEDCHKIIEDIKRLGYSQNISKIFKDKDSVYSFVFATEGLMLYEGFDMCIIMGHPYAKKLMHFLIDSYINEDAV